MHLLISVLRTERYDRTFEWLWFDLSNIIQKTLKLQFTFFINWAKTLVKPSQNHSHDRVARLLSTFSRPYFRLREFPSCSDWLIVSFSLTVIGYKWRLRETAYERHGHVAIFPTSFYVCHFNVKPERFHVFEKREKTQLKCNLNCCNT